MQRILVALELKGKNLQWLVSLIERLLRWLQELPRTVALRREVSVSIDWGT